MGNKILVLAITMLLGFSSFSGSSQAHATITALQPQTEKVLICNSSAKAYHSYMCYGLKNCTHEILTITKSDAIKRGRNPCKICYK